MTFDEIKSEEFAKLVGLCSHFCYWCILGGYNQSPLDEYHMKQLFISMLQIVSAIEVKYNRTKKVKQVFTNFTMPMLILAMRVEIDIIFKNNYRCFLGKRGLSPNNE